MWRLAYPDEAQRGTSVATPPCLHPPRPTYPHCSYLYSPFFLPTHLSSYPLLFLPTPFSFLLTRTSSYPLTFLCYRPTPLPTHPLPLTTFKTHTRLALEGADIELLGLNSAGRLGASLSIAPKRSPPRLHKTINHSLQIVFLDGGHTRVASILRHSARLTDEASIQSS